MKHLFDLLDLEFFECKNKNWVESRIEIINNAITNNFFCISLDYKYGDFRDVTTYIFKDKQEMDDFKKIEEPEESKWASNLFFSDGYNVKKLIDC